MAVEDNPFRLPPDDQIFLIREQERQKRAEERERVKQLRVWEKTTASSNVRRSRRIDDGTDDAQLGDTAAKQTRGARTESVGRDPRREKENVSEFVAKKREMFLVQMSLDVKQAEILKLDEKAKQKEEALKKSSVMLDEDITRFDAFLQSNDQKAHKAMKDAENMTKIKQERLQRIKLLKSQLSAIQSEIAKLREQKDECIKFKGFLEKLTPPEWKDDKALEKVERKKARKEAYMSDRQTEINRRCKEELEAEDRNYEDKQKGEKPSKRPDEIREREKELEKKKKAIRRKYDREAEAVDAEYKEVSSGAEMPLYFEEPKQLLDVFTALEESNLFLIQNSQDTEQSLEELQQKFAEMKRTSDAKTGKMKQNITHLEKQISDEKSKCEELRQMLSQKHGATEQEELLEMMAVKVADVHVACGQTSDHDPDTLQMLGAIEAKLEDFLSALDEAEECGLAAQVEALERYKEKDRRELVRKQRKEQQDRKIEERLKASLQRSQAPIHKKVGKQIMFRSAPLFQARRVVQEDDGFEEAVKEHDVFGIWIGKDGAPNAQQPSRQN
jgi:hypothetical protein